MAYVRVDNAVKYFPREDGTNMLVLDKVSFDTKEFGITCLLGPSGCGKSTLLNAISGLERLDQGQSGSYFKPRRVQVANAEAWLCFSRSAPAQLEEGGGKSDFCPQGDGYPQQQWPERLQKYLNLVGLIEFRNQFPLYLSGGMRQRVGLARGLVIEPEVLLMDEPFSKLDQLTARRLREESLQICARLKQTTVMVTHDVEEAAYMGDRIVILRARPARIVDIMENLLPPGQRDVDDPQFIRFKKSLLQTVLKLMEKDEVLL